MGLDISAYSHLREATPETHEMLHRYEMEGKGTLPKDFPNYVCVNINDSFPHAAPDMRGDHYYVGIPGQSDSHRFRAGSYSGYGNWRRHLCLMALQLEAGEFWHKLPESGGFGEFEGKPFVELLNFSDCEGTIGTKVSAKLYNDFVAYEERAKEYAAKLEDKHSREVFIELYQDWKRAFELAKDDGLVDFH